MIYKDVQTSIWYLQRSYELFSLSLSSWMCLFQKSCSDFGRSE